ncbi:hypothetical protein I2I05_21080 [Hymenobacter sp. BT683]|uniref:Uncharacterized protein n=1 Tax=Hymenobacter jeongseonensis TaxID=2791027 RepID=A0ABS0IPB9_9BACT|nr:hypothetical protein [Hymenobacter jeongseonensis]MBF9239899.1 hypothetical protein [Hymenobacter jeongseonensis]
MNTLYRILLSGLTCLVLSAGGCDKEPDAPAPTSCPTPLAFSASMDGQGSILISGVSGGTAPYSYAVTDQNYQASEVFAGPYPDGSYVVSVRSAGGCFTSQLVSLTRTLPTSDLQLLTNGSSKNWRATRVVDQNGTTVQSCNSTPFTMTFTASYAVRLAQYSANGAGGACVLNENNATFLLGNGRRLTVRGKDFNGNSVDEYYQITRLDDKNLELSGITDPAKRLVLVN